MFIKEAYSLINVKVCFDSTKISAVSTRCPLGNRDLRITPKENYLGRSLNLALGRDDNLLLGDR